MANEERHPNEAYPNYGIFLSGISGAAMFGN